MKIGFIGAGKVGTAFGAYLTNHNISIYGYYSLKIEDAENAAKQTKSKAFNNLEELVPNSDILFITTIDSKISTVCNFLASENFLKRGSVIVHMSGALSSEILKPAREKGCLTYSLHPLQSFAHVEKTIEDLKNTVFSIESDENSFEVIENILKQTGNRYFILNSSQKEVYHAAACVVSNYLVTLIDYGLDLFQSIGIEKELGFKALYPLIEGTINNIYKLGPAKALTGPIVRGDSITIKKHLTALNNHFPDNVDLYRYLALATINLAQKYNLKDKNKTDELIKLLKEGSINVKW